MPLWFVLVGAGIARLLPMMTGDVPIPLLRYVVATLAVTMLIGIHGRTEWQRPHVQAQPAGIASGPVAAPLPMPVARQKTAAAKIDKEASSSSQTVTEASRHCQTQGDP